MALERFMSDTTALGDRMKEYEAVTRLALPRRARPGK